MIPEEGNRISSIICKMEVGVSKKYLNVIPGGKQSQHSLPLDLDWIGLEFDNIHVLERLASTEQDARRILRTM